MRPHRLHSPWNPPGQNTGVGSLSLLQGIFPTQRLNPGLPHCRQILYQLSHKGSPRTLEWIAYSFSGGSSQPRNQTGSPALHQLSYPLRSKGLPSLVAQLVKNPPAMRETWVQSLGWKVPLEMGKATRPSILAWRIPWTAYSPWGCKELDRTK